MRIVAFITDGPTVRDILAHLGEPTAPPRIAPARGPPLREAADPEHDHCADPLLPSVPVLEFDQRLSWRPEAPPLARARRRGGLVPAPASLPASATMSVWSSPLPPPIEA